MTKDEVFTHIRSLLREALDTLGAGVTLLYEDDVLLDQTKAALNYLIAVGVTTDTVVDSSDELTPEPSTRLGVLLALRVVAVLLRGDLTQRLLSGSMGMIFRMGNDLIDTKTAATQFKSIASDYSKEFISILTIELTAEPEVFGGPNAPGV
jgi:hypothetical protein